MTRKDPVAERGERVHEIVTPEGVPVRLVVALAGDRLAAFLLDLLLILLAVLSILIPLAWLASRDVIETDLVLAVVVFLLFVMRAFYFTLFELSWQGQTPGKRRIRIRAVDARGGPLRAEAILARNLGREVDFFLPLGVLGGAEALFPGAPGAARLVALAWLFVACLLPLFNRDRLRIGDLVAGTVVVRQPEAVLLEDLSARPGAREAPSFTTEQLDVYGIYELQTLEEVLRGGGPGRAEILEAVAEKIRAKIGWTERGPTEEFLQAFYAALRGRLEQRLLFGKRRESKNDPAP